MRNFLVELGVSIVASVLFWNFGLARHIWPAHPLLCTTILATVSGMVAHFLLQSEPKASR